MTTGPQKPVALKISNVRLHEIRQLQRLFEQATLEHFSYFPDDVQQRVIAEHSLIPLFKARIDPRRILLAARSRGMIVGYAIAAVPLSGPAQLFWLYVDPRHRGTNTGLSLLSRALRQMGHRGAREVILATHDHRRYYERQGFKFVRREDQRGVTLDIMQFRVRGGQ